ncbi:MAG: LpxI family protein [Planctomycetes bacterium]|nr:LpxI family protein [Planctomycetota bacterium]
MTLIETSNCVLAGEGVLGSVLPSHEHTGDIAFGWRLLQQLVELEIGYGMVVRECDVIAVQATEDILSVILRSGELCRRKGWALLKSAAAHDPPGEGVSPLPVIDTEIIKALAAAGGGCLAVNAKRVLFADKPRVIEAANRAKIAVVGVVEDSWLNKKKKKKIDRE